MGVTARVMGEFVVVQPRLLARRESGVVPSLATFQEPRFHLHLPTLIRTVGSERREKRPARKDSSHRGHKDWKQSSRHGSVPVDDQSVMGSTDERCAASTD